MPLGTLLVVEDDAAIRRGIVDLLGLSGYRALEAADGAAGVEIALSAEIDLILMDLLMPRMDGMTALKEIRRVRPGLPVIILTAKGEEQDRVRGLREGADDYVVKPFSAAELLARDAAVMRRSAERPKTVGKLTIAGRKIDLEKREVLHDDGERCRLTEREVGLLQYLAANRGRAISRDELLSRVWGLDPRGVQTRTVDMAVARVRELLRDDSAQPAVILTLRAKGYMLIEEDGGTDADGRGGGADQ